MFDRTKKERSVERSLIKFHIRSCLYRCPCIFFTLVLLVLNITFFTSSGAYAAEDEIIIKEIEVSGLSRISRDELLYLLDLKTGQLLDKKKISSGLRRTFKKGVFLDIQVISEPVKEGVKLKFVVKEVPIVNKVSFGGIENLPKKDIKKEFLFKKGDDYREELLEKAKLKLAKYYQRRGYPEAVIRIFSSFNNISNEVDLHVLINQGRPLIVKNVTLPENAEIFIRMIRGDVLTRKELKET